MALFSATIWKEPVFSWAFHFVAISTSSSVQFHKFVAWNISTVVFLPISSSVDFLSLFMFLLPQLDAVISLSLLFLISSSRIYIDVSTQSPMLSSLLPPFFLDTYTLSMSSLGCKAFLIVINFLVLWSICPRLCFVHPKNGLEDLTRRTAQVFITLMRFLLQILVSRNPFVLRFSFLISFSFISACLMVSISNIPKVFVVLSLSPKVLMLSW